MKAYLRRARFALYGVVDSLFLLSRSRTAFRKCHQQSWIFTDSHTSRSMPISAISLSVCVKIGMMPYLSRRTAAQLLRAFFCFPISRASAVDKRQYVKGKPVLSYSPIMLYNSRLLEFVLSVYILANTDRDIK